MATMLNWVWVKYMVTRNGEDVVDEKLVKEETFEKMYNENFIIDFHFIDEVELMRGYKRRI